MSMLPGVSKIKKQMDNANIDESIIKTNEAIIIAKTNINNKYCDNFIYGGLLHIRTILILYKIQYIRLQFLFYMSDMYLIFR